MNRQPPPPLKPVKRPRRARPIDDPQTDENFLQYFRTSNFFNDSFNSPSKYFETCVKIGNRYAYLKPSDKSTPPSDFVYSIPEMLARPGLYTWLYYIGQDGAKKFAAAKVFGAEEKMSKHKHIYMNVNAKYVLLAGEINVLSATNVIYNFQSGTFMAKITMNIKHSNYFLTNITNKQKNEFERMLKANGVKTIQFNEYSFDKDIELDNELLQKYISKGYEVEYFNSPDGCEDRVRNYMSNKTGGERRRTRKNRNTMRKTRRHRLP
jgi:hypothetical protein